MSVLSGNEGLAHDGTAYSEIEDVAGMSLSLVKKATLQRARGDAAAAALTDGVYARMLADHSEASVGNGSAQAELAV